MTTETTSVPLMTADTLLQNWQGHRRVTRKVIEAFPENKLFNYSIGGMRPFGEMACELLGMGAPLVHGVATGEWTKFESGKPATKAELLRMWDTQTTQLNIAFPEIPEARFGEVDKAFGQWEMTGLEGIQYAIDNEIHHRGEGYVYLRSLGIEPPPFWDRN